LLESRALRLVVGKMMVAQADKHWSQGVSVQRCGLIKTHTRRSRYRQDARGGAPEGKGNGNYRQGGKTKEMIEVWQLIKSLR